MFCATKLDALNFEVDTDERVQIDVGDNHVTSQDSGRFVCDAKRLTKLFENVRGEKRDLADVIVAVIKKPIAANAMASDAFDPPLLDKWKIVRRLAVMAKIVVTGRSEDLSNDHPLDYDALTAV